MRKEFTALVGSFSYAAAGIWSSLCTQRNFRLHTVLAGGALWLGRAFLLSATQWALLWLTIALVLSLELLNTAIETAVDYTGRQRHPLAKLAKDTAAGAVLVGALGSVGVALSLFGDWNRWAALFTTLAATLLTPWGALLFLMGALLLFFYVFHGPGALFSNKNNKPS